MKKIKKIPGACAVCALQYVSGIDEEAVLRICAMNGFKTGRGMYNEEWKSAAETLSIKMRGVAFEPRILRHFIRDYQNGLFLVVTHDHMFVVDNGIIVDPRNKKPPGLKRRIVQAWRVDGAGSL